MTLPHGQWSLWQQTIRRSIMSWSMIVVGFSKNGAENLTTRTVGERPVPPPLSPPICYIIFHWVYQFLIRTPPLQPRRPGDARFGNNGGSSCLFFRDHGKVVLPYYDDSENNIRMCVRSNHDKRVLTL